MHKNSGYVIVWSLSTLLPIIYFTAALVKSESQGQMKVVLLVQNCANLFLLVFLMIVEKSVTGGMSRKHSLL